MQHIKDCNFDRIDLISDVIPPKQRTWLSSEFNAVVIYICINAKKLVKNELKYNYFT